MMSIPKGAQARRKRAVSRNSTPIIAMPENPSAMEKSHQNPEPDGTGPINSTNSGANTSAR